ncbi:hypothetical protein PAMP_009052 [Pampus punctatissimus]
MLQSSPACIVCIRDITGTAGGLRGLRGRLCVFTLTKRTERTSLRLCGFTLTSDSLVTQ